MSAYSIATRGLAGRKIPQGVLAAINTLLFGASEQGALYDPSDLPTLFQDSAGTTPVTAIEQPVGLMLDKSGRGNHALQATTTKRPVYSRRVNRLLDTEDLTAASWLKMVSGTGSLPVITPGQLAPDGSYTAFRVQLNRGAGSSSSDYSTIRQAINLVGAGRRTIWCKSNTGSTQTFSLVATLSSDVVSATTSWASVTGGSLSSAGQLDISNYGPVPTTQNLDIIVWHPDVRSNDTPIGIPAYQRVNTATDYDADPAKFPAYLRFDGIDDALQTANIDFTGTDKMTVWAGVTKLSDAAFADIVNTGIISAAPGFYLGNSAGGQNFVSRGRGSVLGATTTASGYTAPNTSIFTGIFDISGSKSNLRVNGALTTNSSSLGTGNFSNSPMYIGASNGTSDYFNGRLYSLIVRGAQSSQSQIEACELYVKQKMRLP